MVIKMKKIVRMLLIVGVMLVSLGGCYYGHPSHYSGLDDNSWRDRQWYGSYDSYYGHDGDDGHDYYQGERYDHDRDEGHHNDRDQDHGERR
jgi:hypothetical protein